MGSRLVTKHTQQHTTKKLPKKEHNFPPWNRLRQTDELIAMMSSVTKKSRLPRTAAAAHGLRWTRGSRGGSLAGALHSMPAEASSAVVRENNKKKKKKKRRAICTTELEVLPKGVNMYAQNFGRTQDKKNSPVQCSPFVVGRCNRSGQNVNSEF